MVQSQFRVAAVFALAGAMAAACGSPPEPAAPERPDIVLITIDTLRADRPGRGVTPGLDALAARGVFFTNARATAPLTLPSHVSMFTGALPPVHGVRENGVHRYSGTPASATRRLKDAGYATAAFVGAYVLDRRFGLADGFDHYDDQITRDPEAVQRLEAERPANEVVDRALAWIRDPQSVIRNPESGSRTAETGLRRPVFLWVHLYDPHAPHNGTYDDDVRFADGEAARLLRELASLGRDPVIIVAGDHGESLGDHGEATHGMLVYDAALRVPLIVAGPGLVRARRDDAVSVADIAPTLLARAGVVSEPGGDDRDLLAPVTADREVYAESTYPRVAGWSPVYALVQGRWKAVVSNRIELYDLAADPGESTDVASRRQQHAAAMSARIASLRKAEASSPRSAPPPDAVERLRALGYVSGPSAAAAPGNGPNPADHIAAWGEFERALANLGRPGGRALPALKQLADAYPGAPVFQSTYARALSDAGRIDAALAVYRRAVATWADDPALFHDLAVAARASGKAGEAMKADQAALALDAAYAPAHNGVGLLMTDAARHGEAAAAFERATAGDPTNAEYWVNLGNARRGQGDIPNAMSAYERAAAFDPQSADAANGIGVLLVQRQRAGEAIPWFERAVRAQPAFVEARLNLGIALQESGDRARAAESYREVLARAPAGSAERRAAADLLRSLGQ